MLQADLPYEVSTPRQVNDLTAMAHAVPTVLVHTNLTLLWVVLAFALTAGFALLSAL